jgi:excinuclease ABC subunit A
MFIGGMSEEAKVKEIRGLTPTISIEQKTVAHNPRSTVGTITEIYDFYRLMFLSLGTRVCPHDGSSMEKRTHKDVIDFLQKEKNGKTQTAQHPREETFKSITKKQYSRKKNVQD